MYKYGFSCIKGRDIYYVKYYGGGCNDRREKNEKGERKIGENCIGVKGISIYSFLRSNSSYFKHLFNLAFKWTLYVSAEFLFLGTEFF